MKKSLDLLASLLKNSGSANLPPEIYPDSPHRLPGAVVAAAKTADSHVVLVVAESSASLPDGFEGDRVDLDGGAVGLICPKNAVNAAALRKHFPWCAPRSLRKERTTIGCGDRLGLATFGQLRAAKKYALSPVLAQQSMRELSMTGRTFRGVVDDAVFQVFAADFQSGYGADGDHLKKISDIDVALDAGMPMITLDLSEVMNAAAGDWPDGEINCAFAALPETDQTRTAQIYFDKTFDLGSGVQVKLDAATARRCAVMYNRALDFAEEVYRHLQERRGDEFDLEISIDETTSPTLPSHHLYIVSELKRRGVVVSSLAPRFIGEFQKAVDYIGDLSEFDRQFKVHARIAKAFGGYKISVHSGSDKFAVYPTVGRETEGYLHLKTAGTSWLVAVLVIAQNDPALYREMHRFAEAHFEEMLKLYHITADLTRIPNLDSLSDADLPGLVESHPDARQLMHITYGPILTGPLRARFFAAMHRFEEEYAQALEKHFNKHFSLLNIPRKG